MIKRFEKIDENERKIRNLEIEVKKLQEILDTRLNYLEKKLLEENEKKKLDKEIKKKERSFSLNKKMNSLIEPLKNEIKENSEIIKKISSSGNSSL
jgi:DNA repair ATPase RecN